MRNLKRTLSLLLAVVMVIGLMVVGAGAVSYNDFSDRGEIVNKDAVSMLTTLGIIEGQPDGSYNPTGDVDRAQMAKMISVALTNNEDCDTLYQNVNSGLTDITANWARGYINYCYVRGIIAGRGDNTFDPSANVTGVEAAKMLLAALGYNAEIEGLVGPDWALNTAALAQQLGIFRNFTKDVSEPLNRDDAALLIYNALDVEMIQQYSNGYALVYGDHRTILSSVFGVIRVEGVVVGNEWARLEETDSDAALRTGKTTLDNVVWYDSTTANTVVDEGVRETQPVTFNVTTPVEYIGKAVTMYVEKTTILSNSIVVGVATNDDLNVIYASANGDDTAKDALDGTDITVDRNTEYYVNYGYCEDSAEAVELVNDYQKDSKTDDFNLNGVEVEVIDNDKDGTAEYVLYTRETLSEVVRYNERDEVLSFYASDVGTDRLYDNDTPVTARVDFDDLVIAEGDELSTDDLILYVQYGGRTYVSLADIVTGTMTRVDRDREDELYITIDGGDEYYESFIRDEASDADVDVMNFNVKEATEDPGFDTLYDFILDSNGFVVAIRPAEEVVTNYALVLDSAWTQNALRRGGQVEILSADGTTGTYDIDWDESVDSYFGSDTALEKYLGTRDVNSKDDPDDTYYRDTGAAKGTLITYSLDEDNVLTIERVMEDNALATNSLEIVSNKDNVDSTAGVGDHGTIIHYNPYLTFKSNGDFDDHSTTKWDDCNVQYAAMDGYENGDGSITVTGINDAADKGSKTYAVDRNTVAFYYWVDEDGDVRSEVLTGWDEMSTVPAGTHVQVYPVLTKTNDDEYKASNLAGVIVFEAETAANDNDYLFVLNRNAYTTGKTLWLNVVFEDGTVAEIEVDHKPHANAFDADETEDFMQAYSYVENSDGTYDLYDVDTKVVKNDVYADLLQVGTVAYATKLGGTDTTDDYIAYTEDVAKVWDVTGVNDDEDEVSTGNFRKNVEVNAAIVIDGNAIRTAWIWDVKEDANPGIDDTNPVPTEVIEIDEDHTTIYLRATVGADNRVAVVREALIDAGYSDVSYAYDKATNEYTFSADDRYGFRATFTTETIWYDDVVVGAMDIASAGTTSDWESGMVLIGSGDALDDAGRADDCIPTDRHMVFTFKTVAGQKAELVIVDENDRNIYTESYTYSDNAVHSFYVNIDDSAQNYQATPSAENPRTGYLAEIPSHGIQDGNYSWTVTMDGKIVESGTFTVG